MDGRQIMKQWGLWIGLPVLALAILMAVVPGDSAARTSGFIVGTFIWAIFVARPNLQQKTLRV